MPTENETLAFEQATKYLCTLTCGRCPMVMENFPCPEECSEETRPWRCWVAFFRQHAVPAPDTAAEPSSVHFSNT